MGLETRHLANLDLFTLNLLFEFSIEYDIQRIRQNYAQKKIKDEKEAPPPDDVMKAPVS